MKKYTIDELYDFMRNYIISNNRRPTHLIVHPYQYNYFQEEFLTLCYTHYDNEGRIHYGDVKIIRSYDIEENEILFLS